MVARMWEGPSTGALVACRRVGVQGREGHCREDTWKRRACSGLGQLVHSEVDVSLRKEIQDLSVLCNHHHALASTHTFAPAACQIELPVAPS